MLTEKELLQAIRECESEPITSSKVGKLADFYIVYDHLFGEPYTMPYANVQTEKVIETSGTSDFARAINGKNLNRVMPILEELFDTINALHPKMYDKVIEKLSDL